MVWVLDEGDIKELISGGIVKVLDANNKVHGIIGPKFLEDEEGIDNKNTWVPQDKQDTLVCNAVRKNPYEFVNILRETAQSCYKSSEHPEHYLLFMEAACVIANLLEVRDISEPNFDEG